MFIDTHTHLYVEQFSNDIDEVIQGSKSSQIDFVFLPNIDLDSVPNMLALCASYPHYCYPMLGLHPCSVKEGFENVLEKLKSFFDLHQILAIGEVGMDLYWDKSTQHIQSLAFIEQMKWGVQYNLPLSIHSRDATQELIDLIAQNSSLISGGVFHCFGGTLEQAKVIIDLGYYIGVGGSLTYKKSDLPNIIAQLPLESIVLETDAPFLPPTPFRGKRNEPKYIPIIANSLATLFEITIENLGEITSRNAKKLFSKAFV